GDQFGGATHKLPYTNLATIVAGGEQLAILVECSGGYLGFVALEFGDALASREVPNLGNVVATTGDQETTIGINAHGTNSTSSAELTKLGATGGVPKSDGVVASAGDQSLAVGE